MVRDQWLTFIVFSTVILLYLGYLWVGHVRRREAEKKVLGRRVTDMISQGSLGGERDVSLLREKKTLSGFEKIFQSKIDRVQTVDHYLLRAGINISLTRFVLMALGLGVVLGGGAYGGSREIILSLVVGLAGVFVLPSLTVIYLTKRRISIFVNSFPEALDMMRRGLRAGHTIDRALEVLGEEIKGIVGESFYTISQKVKLGQPLETALGDMASRLGVNEFRMLAILIVLQRETGGSLSEAVDSLANIIRERQKIQRKVRALTAEGRMGAMVISVIPLVLLAIIFVLQPGFLDPLFLTQQGHKLLLMGAVSMSMGILVIRHMVNKDPYE